MILKTLEKYTLNVKLMGYNMENIYLYLLVKFLATLFYIFSFFVKETASI